MFKLGNKVVMTQEELKQYGWDIRDKQEKSLREEYQLEYSDRLEEQETTIKNQKKTIRSLTEDKDNLKTKVEVFEENRDEVREIVKQKLDNEDLESVLTQRKDSLDKREADLMNRATKLGTEEDKQYKSGYADGVADGVRKISEITQKDRENAMKIAMVAASSHTPVENLKELNNVHQLTAGNTDKKA